MPYVYHMVPKNMLGEQLIPLNELKTIDESLYHQYTKKYLNHQERKKLLTRQIPKMNCLWNDVIHFLPLHPSHVYAAIKDVGIPTKNDVIFYKIPISNLKLNKNAIFHYSKETYRGPAAEMSMDEIELLDLMRYEELSAIPNDTVDYYIEEFKKGTQFGLFPFIPHILSLGRVNVSNVETINWSDGIK
ncbi:group-specific protein [Paenalkalicoccus suaedae]|uniref:Group-specific protein n=1 Tax=Paenalkalicoccus suaedae TaxID=2592382 RepID=A0A859FKM8_9BACI|nr:group-specific protein [Paenalkalicoccus suaedae]QKS73342.1 group-specific protein [Paenalkalicoccus suaedae]